MCHWLLYLSNKQSIQMLDQFGFLEQKQQQEGEKKRKIKQTNKQTNKHNQWYAQLEYLQCNAMQCHLTWLNDSTVENFVNLSILCS